MLENRVFSNLTWTVLKQPNHAHLPTKHAICVPGGGFMLPADTDENDELKNTSLSTVFDIVGDGQMRKVYLIRW